MIDRKTKLRIRRRYRRSRRQVEDIGVQAEEQLERHFIRRLTKLYEVRRFVLGWVILLVLLSGLVVAQARGLSQFYQDSAPAPGGIYREGIIGTFTNANPLYAVSSVDSSVSRLIFSGLLKYDTDNKLTGDLAESWSVNADGKVYTVVLRENLYWHDGSQLTSADVVFTYETIQDPDARSPLFSSWTGVKVRAMDQRTVEFTLPSTLASFPHSLTNGIVPRHLLEETDMTRLRSADFNTIRAVGSGPFRLETVEVEGSTPEQREELIGLVPYADHHFDTPKLQRFIIRTFRSEDRMLKSFNNREINAMVGLNSIPDTLDDDMSVRAYNMPLTGSVMAFFKTGSDNLNQSEVRQALVRAVDTTALVNGLGFPSIRTDGPLLPQHVGYKPGLTQLPYDVNQARKLLNSAGWKRGTDGIVEKDGVPLRIRMVAQNTSEFAYVAQVLQRSWREIGVAVDVTQPTETEFQTAVSEHNYDVLLYGISIGVDPDVFAYWHSSQADPRATNRLNFSEYKSRKADIALEGGRTRIDGRLRAIKYEPFLEQWRKDAPALALYRPRFLYVVRGGLYNFEPRTINTATDRFNNVQDWMVRQTKIIKE